MRCRCKHFLVAFYLLLAIMLRLAQTHRNKTLVLHVHIIARDWAVDDA
jgi:hypothetical protein